MLTVFAIGASAKSRALLRALPGIHATSGISEH
jgi:hypothetical protein